MPEIDISEAIGSGFSLITRRPLAVLAWGLLPMLALLLIFLLFGGGIIAAIASVAKSGADEPAPEQILGLFGAFFGALLLFILMMAAISTVVRAAVYRAELEPDASQAAYLRFGGQELWLFLANFVLGFVLFGAQFVMLIPLTILTTAIAVGGAMGSGGDARSALAGTIGLRLVGQLVVSGVGAWLWLRLCLGPVMSFRERQFRLFESWELTKGHVLRMFLVMLVVYVIVVVIELFVVGIGAVAVIALVAANPAVHSPEAFFSQPPAAWMGALAPAVVIVFILGTLMSGLATAMIYAPVARMYRQLVPSADTATTFA